MYRFRSIDSLIERFEELQRQEIYFASPKELNDPLEGLKVMVFEGDKILWGNLFKHYICCLFYTQAFKEVFKENFLDIEDINVFIKNYKLPPIMEGFFKEKEVSLIIEILSKEKKKVYKEELLKFLKKIHLLVTLFMMDKKISEKGITQSKEVISLQNKLIIEDKIFEELSLTHYFCSEQDHKIRKQIFGDIQFSKKYLKSLEKLTHCEWYTACFMSECSNSSVWGHYGDSHKGVCLKFKTGFDDEFSTIKLKDIVGVSGHKIGDEIKEKLITKDVEFRFKPINYTNTHCEIDFFESLGSLPIPQIESQWLTNNIGERSSRDLYSGFESEWRKSYWDNHEKIITTKTKDWGYEKEYRLVKDSLVIDLSIVENRKFKYEFTCLEGIIFGIKTELEDKVRIFKIIKEKCLKEKRTGFKFYQAKYNPLTGKIDYDEKISLNNALDKYVEESC